MILAAGLTPAWQYLLIFDDLTPGEVNRAREARWFASGKAVNVALACQSLKAPSSLVSFTGGPSGQALVDDFEAAGASAHWVTSSSPTRVCTTLINKAASQTTELVENSAAVSGRELERFRRTWIAAAETADVLVLSGSLPKETPPTYYRELLDSVVEVAPAMRPVPGGPARLVLDIRGPELLGCLSHRPFLVKPNREELAATVNRSLNDDAALLDAMRELNAAGAEWVLVTEGGDPAWLTGQGGTWRCHPAPDVAIVNPIGCGDSVAAGIAVALSEGQSPHACVALGLAAAAANLEQMESARFQNSRARQLAATIQIETVPSG